MPKPGATKGWPCPSLGRFAEAGACLDRALQLDANNPEYWSNRAISWAEQGQFEAALHDHAQAVALAPQDAGGHYNQALLWLRLKQFEPGFEAYEWRWELEHFSSPRLNTSVPLWRGPGHGRQVLLWSEQGLGDEVLYASMVSLLKADQGCFTLSADQRLVPALQKGMSHIQVVSHTQAQQMLVQGLFDAQAPSGSLGRLLRVDESKLKARSMPYLQADEQRLQSMQKQLAARRTGPVCGVSWRSKSQLIGAGKSIDLPLWSDVWRTPGWSFVNLQYGDTRHEREALQQSTGVHIGHIEGLDLFNDLQGLLALIQSCDCVITTSNVTAHLAGALGKKALVLVPHGKSKIWYWHDDDDFSMWYPALKLIHQAHPGAWEPEMQQAADWLTRAKF